VTQWQEYAIANGWMKRAKLAISSSEGTQLQSDFAPGTPLPFIYDDVDENRESFCYAGGERSPFYPDLAAFAASLSPLLSLKRICLGTLLKAARCREGVLGDSFFSDPTGLTALAVKKDHRAFHALSHPDTESAATILVFFSISLYLVRSHKL
jgi:hypothetical protein